jgi:hypothetical protein
MALHVARSMEDGVNNKGRYVALVNDEVRIDGEEVEAERGKVRAEMPLTRM